MASRNPNDNEIRAITIEQIGEERTKGRTVYAELDGSLFSAWSTPVEIVKAVKRPVLNISTLSPEGKRVWWETIKRDAPAVADLLADPNYQNLVATFQADVLIYREDLPCKSE